MIACSLGQLFSIRPVSLEGVRRLLMPHPTPCLSLYLPTHRNVPGNTVDLPAYGHLVEALELAIAGMVTADEDQRLLAPFRQLRESRGFWRHTRDGLGVLAADGVAQVFLLQRPVAPLAMASERFHTLPLVRTAAAAERFNMLTLTSREARVYEGLATEGRLDRLDPVPLHDPGTAGHPDTAKSPGEILRDEAVDAEVFQPHRVQRGMGPAGMGFGGIVHGGTGSKQDDIEADTAIFFRHVDELVHERVTRHSGLPLVLVALPRLAAVFRGLSKNRLLMDAGVAHDVHLLEPHELGPLVAPLLTAARTARVARALESFAEARPHGMAADDLADVARAAVTGRVAAVLIEADRFEAGRFDPATGAIDATGRTPVDLSRSGDQPAIGGVDLFGSVAETVLLHGGGVLALDKIDMPTESGVAAIYRW